MTNNPIEKLEKVDNHFKTAKFHSFNEVEELEEQGGVYCVYKDNQAIYVGISNNLQKRLKEFVSESRKPLRKKKKAMIHIGAFHIQKKYPDSIPTDYQFKYFVENDLNLYSLYERYLICLYEETLLNVK